MCGIAGILDLTGERPAPIEAVRRMAHALYHRGPDEDGFLDHPGVSLASRRLSIVGLFDGRQPISNEDGSVSVVFNGELFDYVERRQEMQSRGHVFRTHTDTELVPHWYEDHGERMFDKMKGQFAVALWDSKQRKLILGRDRFGIAPLHWARVRRDGGDWLLFASEIKGLLASGMIDARPDVRGLNHMFTFFAMPGPATCFEGIEALLPGHYLEVRPAQSGRSAILRDHIYWQLDFPDRGDEVRGDKAGVVEQFESLLLKATEKRLRADVPVVSYLSGGVDSSTVVALACHLRKDPIPSFTIRIKAPKLDETTEAGIVANHLNSRPVIVDCGADEVVNTYPRLIRAAESPVIDTSCAALLLLAQEVHRQGYKAALTGEGADEWLAGYPWYKVNKLLSYLDVIPGLKLGRGLRRFFLWLTGAPRYPKKAVQRTYDAVCGDNPWLDIYGIVSMSKLYFFSPETWERIGDNQPFEDLQLNQDRMRKWHPLHRGLYLAGRIHLAGHLLAAKGDRIAMHSSVETRYPFLDEDVFDFLAKLHPRWKMPGFRDKYILRLVAERWLPKEIAWRRKAMFRAPFDSFHLDTAPPYVEQLLSEESLRKTGYFKPEAVKHWRQEFKNMSTRSARRLALEMGLTGVISTQLWHQIYIDSSLADVPDEGYAGPALYNGRAKLEKREPLADPV